MKRFVRRDILLILVAIVLLTQILFTVSCAETVPAPNIVEKRLAAEQMQMCMQAIKGYKSQRGVPLHPEDIHQTGMIGEEFNLITTTLGDLEAKRTTANSDMAALCVEILQEAGLVAGDRVGLNLSGSFPALNIALLCACDQLELEVVCYSSVGASTYGANNPELSFPEMLGLLIDDGLLPAISYTVTLGGDRDVGIGMDPELVTKIERRLQAQGTPVWREPDYQKNIAARIAQYDSGSGIDCYIGVGGNTTSLGLNDEITAYGLILPQERLPAQNDTSGLLTIYHERGVPVINLLDIKRLVAEYGLAFDPMRLPLSGESSIFYSIVYRKAPILLSLALCLAAMIAYRVRSRYGNSQNT